MQQPREMVQKQHGSMPNNNDIISDTNSHTEKWSAILIPSTNPAVFEVLKQQDGTDYVTAGAAEHIPTDMYFMAQFTEIKLTSGMVFAAKCD